MNPEYRNAVEDRANQSLDCFNIYIEMSLQYLVINLDRAPTQSEINDMATSIMLLEKLDLIVGKLNNIYTGL